MAASERRSPYALVYYWCTRSFEAPEARCLMALPKAYPPKTTYFSRLSSIVFLKEPRVLDATRKRCRLIGVREFASGRGWTARTWLKS